MNGFTLSEVIAAKPEEIYRAWLSSEGHTAMTGSPAVVEGRGRVQRLGRVYFRPDTGTDTESADRSDMADLGISR
jgi:hypothetical protein